MAAVCSCCANCTAQPVVNTQSAISSGANTRCGASPCRPLSAKPLTQCPACKKPVRKVISSFSSPLKLKPTSISDAKKAGFTVYKKLSKGEYERQ